MPGKHGRLSPEETAKAQKWLNAHAPNPCHGCGKTAWALAEHMINLVIYTPGAFTIGGPTYPALLMVCQACGLFRMHSAVLAGVIPTPANIVAREAKSGK
jgi:hypothetical protein